MLAIIGGTGLTNLENLKITRREVVRTPYGEPSGHLTFGKIGKAEVVFLARHGYGHTIAPHEVNYRANIWALQSVGVTPGPMSAAMPPTEFTASTRVTPTDCSAQILAR